MSANANNSTSSQAQVRYGKGRKPGFAGPEASYILKSVQRWRLRGDGYLESKKKK